VTFENVYDDDARAAAYAIAPWVIYVVAPGTAPDRS
jgi:hypothetical protein